MISAAVFPDTTVLCNFAAVGRLDLLETMLRGRGHWTEAVHAEVQKSRGHLSGLRSALEGVWLGEPIEVTGDGDIAQVERVRRAVFGGRSERPLQHLGEAQTCHLLLTDESFRGAWWVSDDRQALRYARGRGITTMETMDLLRHAVADYDVTAEQAHRLLEQMEQAGRHLRTSRCAADLQ